MLYHLEINLRLLKWEINWKWTSKASFLFKHLLEVLCWERLNDAGKDWRQEKGMTEDEMVGWCHRLDGHEFEQASGVDDRQGSLPCCSPWDCKESDMTEPLNWYDSDRSFNFSWRSELVLCTGLGDDVYLWLTGLCPDPLPTEDHFITWQQKGLHHMGNLVAIAISQVFWFYHDMT